MTTQLGTKLLTDPYTGIGYELPEQEADIVTCSHSHFDHAYLAAVRGTPQVFSAPGKYSCKDFQLEGFASFHDDVKGGKTRQKHNFCLSGRRIARLSYG